jgi:hypothetical protein
LAIIFDKKIKDLIKMMFMVSKVHYLLFGYCRMGV